MWNNQFNSGVLAFVINTAVVLNTTSAQSTNPAPAVGDQISRSIKHDEEHVYTLASEAGQYLDIEVLQEGTNIGVTVFAPDGTVLAAEDAQKHVHAIERLSLVAEYDGIYRIKLTPRPGFFIQTGLDANAFVWDGERRVPYEAVNNGGEYTMTISKAVANDDELDRIDRIFRPYAISHSAGVSVGIVKDGQLLFGRGYGLANLEYEVPISPHTPFHIASLSKQFTGYAIATLHDAGKLSLDDDIRKYLPELQISKRITIRQMLNHTSGIRDQWVLAALAGWRMDDVITQHQLLRLIFRQEALNFPPGTVYHYSNSNYTLAAEIVRRVTGMTLREWTSTEIFEPLGMLHTFVYDDHEEILQQRAYSYDDRSGTVKKSILSFANCGATSLFTTVHDFVKWMANFRQQSVGNSHIFELLTTPGKLIDGTRLTYGLGVGLNLYKGFPTINHSGADAGYRSFMLYFPEQDLGIIILSNLASCNTSDLAYRTANILLDLPSEGEEEALTPKAPTHPYAALEYESTTPAADYIGTYYCKDIQTTYRIIEQDGKLFLTHKRLEDIRLIPSDYDRFKGTYWVFNNLEFHRNSQGVVTRFSVSNGGVINMEFVKLTQQYDEKSANK